MTTVTSDKSGATISMPADEADKLGGAITDVLGLDYRRSAEVAGVAERLVAKHAVTFAQLGEFSILYLLRKVEGDQPATTIDALAKCVKAPALWRDVFGVDAAIWVDERYWKAFGERQREAVVMHELLHIGVNDKGRVKLLEHSVEEFGMVVATYGQWRPELERFASQMGMFDEATQGGQTTIDQAVDQAIDETVERVNAGELGPNATASRGSRRSKPKPRADADDASTAGPLH